MSSRAVCSALALVALAACGGGGGGPTTCTPTVVCASATCGTPDGCGGTCGQGGLPCQAAGAARVDGGLTNGAARLVGPAHQVQGALVPAAPGVELRGPDHVIQQGSLR